MLKRFLLVLVLAAAAAFAIWLGMHGGSSRLSNSAVTSLLPKDTVAVIHLPDLRDARAQWHDSELFKLWQEPAVQAFLERPLAANRTAALASGKMQTLAALRVRDVFLAVLPPGAEQTRFLGGFRFDGNRDEVDRVLREWRGDAPAVPVETVSYQNHSIQVAREGARTVASAFTRDWFFAASEVESLKTILDRADGRARDASATLAADETFVAAFKHMPRGYLALGYLRPDRYLEKMAAFAGQNETRQRQLTFLRGLQSIAGAIMLEGGKMRDVLFVAMPKRPDQPELTRSLLSLASADSFLYSAAVSPLATSLDAQGLISMFAPNTISAEEWRAAFESELSVIGEWPAEARMPGLLAAIRVKDPARARQLLETAMAANNDTPWVVTEKKGTRYFTRAQTNALMPIATTIALSDELLVAAVDTASAEAAMTRSRTAEPGHGNLGAFKAAEHTLPTAKTAFVYLDMRLLYTRLDAALRPMLVMAAAFLPSLTETIDLAKLPDAEVVTRHLSPMTASQRYEGDGYVTESYGAMSLFELAAGLAIAGNAGADLYRRFAPTIDPGAGGAPAPAFQSIPLVPLPSPAETPAEP